MSLIGISAFSKFYETAFRFRTIYHWIIIMFNAFFFGGGGGGQEIQILVIVLEVW